MDLCLLINFVIRGSRSALSKSFNNMLYKCRLAKNILNTQMAHNICKHIIVNSFSTDIEVLYRGTFAQDIVYKR